VIFSFLLAAGGKTASIRPVSAEIAADGLVGATGGIVVCLINTVDLRFLAKLAE